MDRPRAPQGLDADDRVAFGLTAPHLAWLMLASLSAYAVLGSALPTWLRYPIAAIIASAGAALAWARIARRPLDHWLWLWLRFQMRPRRSPAESPTAPAAPTPTARAAPTPTARAASTPTARAASTPTARAVPMPSARTVPTPSAPTAPTPPARTAQTPSASAVPAPSARVALASTTRGAPSVAAPARPADEREPRIVHLPRSRGPGEEPGVPRLRLLESPPPVASGSLPASAGDAPVSVPVFMGSAQRVAFFALKGGVGKTTLAVEVAAYLARHARWRESAGAPAQALRVALLDVDLRSANVSMRLGLTHPTLWDLVAGGEPTAEDLEACLRLHAPTGLRVMLGPPRPLGTAEARATAIARVARVLSHLDETGFHMVFMDLGSEVHELTTYLLEAAHRVCYVITPTAGSVQDAYRGIETLRRMGHRRKVRFVLNQAQDGFDLGEITADLSCTVEARVIRDDAFVEAENRHRPACVAGFDGGIGELARALYPALAESVPEHRSLWRRLRARLA